MPNRAYSATNSYRYGFNGKENDNEVKGEGNQQDYGMRVYDPRLGRFLSFDPLYKQYNYLSTYHFAGNNPIQNKDLDGGEPQDFRENWVPVTMSPAKGGKSEYTAFADDPVLGMISFEAVYDKVTKQYWFVFNDDGKYYYWKVDPGKDQHHHITNRKTGETNGMWVPFKTANKQEAERIMADRTFQLGFAGILLSPGLLIYSSAVAASTPSLIGLSTEATVASRLANSTIDYTTQVIGNLANGKDGVDALTDVNITSITMAAANPGSTWRQLISNNAIGSAFSVSFKEGYNGLGGGRDLETAALQATVGTLTGRATRGIDQKNTSLTARLNHANKIYGSSSKLSASLQSYIRANNIVGVGVGTVAGSTGNALNGTMENSTSTNKIKDP